MSPKKKTPQPAIDKDLAQPPLIPMSDAELKKAGTKLAEKVRELEDMKKEHAEEATMRSNDRKGLQDEISAIASTIRSHGR
jgi:hypothetical protein